MKCLHIPYYKQDLVYSCAPACLQMVLAYYGKRMGEKELIRDLRANADVGTTPGKMIDVARKLGFFCYVNNHSCLEEAGYFLSTKRPVIVYFVEPHDNDDHFSVIIGMDSKNICLHDPFNGEALMMTRAEFDRRWQWRKRYQKWVKRWLLIVSLEEIPLGKNYKPYGKK